MQNQGASHTGSISSNGRERLAHGSFKNPWKNGEALNYVAVMEITSFTLTNQNSLVLHKDGQESTLERLSKN